MNPVSRPAFSPFSIIVVFLALMVIGEAFVPLLDVRFKPDSNLPRLSIRFSWPNASPQVIEQETSKIEGVLGKVNLHLKRYWEAPCACSQSMCMREVFIPTREGQPFM